MGFEYCCMVSLLIIYRIVSGYVVINELNTDEVRNMRYVELKNPSAYEEFLGNYVLELSNYQGDFVVYTSQRLADVTLAAGGLFVVGHGTGDITYDMIFLDGVMHGGLRNVNKAVLYYIHIGVPVMVDEIHYVRKLATYTAYVDTFPGLFLDENPDNSLNRWNINSDVIFITAPLTPGTENTCDGFYRTIYNSHAVDQHMFEKTTILYPMLQTRILQSHHTIACARECTMETRCDVFHFDYLLSSCRIYVKQY